VILLGEPTRTWTSRGRDPGPTSSCGRPWARVPSRWGNDVQPPGTGGTARTKKSQVEGGESGLDNIYKGWKFRVRNEHSARPKASYKAGSNSRQERRTPIRVWVVAGCLRNEVKVY
jgi:hypothetical protein